MLRMVGDPAKRSQSLVNGTDDMKRISALQLGHADEDPELVSVFVGVAS
jgi:hypothetical protein